MSLLALLAPIRAFVTHCGSAKYTATFEVTSLTLRLYKYLAGFIFISFIFTTCVQLFGDHIHCHLQKDINLDKKLFETHCWTTGVHTMVEETESAKLDGHSHGRPTDPPGPGVIPFYASHDRQSQRRHHYYQWIPVVLLLQGVFCYMPYRLWKRMERNRIGRVVIKNIFADKLEFRDADDLVRVFDEKKRQFGALFARFLFCQALGAVILLVQMALFDAFVGGGGFFWQLGLALSNLATLYQTPTSNVTIYDPLIFIFPRLTNCNFSYYAFNGDLQAINGICILPINVLHEKIYTILWFAFWIIFTWTLVSLIGYFILRISPEIRVFLLKMSMPAGTDREALSMIVICGLSEWFVLNIIANNLFDDEFAKFVELLSRKLLRESNNPITLKRHKENGNTSIHTA